MTVDQIGPVYVPQSMLASDVASGVAEQASVQVRPIYAGFWLRAVAYLIDTVLIAPAVGLIVSFYPSAFFKFSDNSTPSLSSLPQPTPMGYAIVAAILLYYALFESSAWQATPGKRILRLYVTDMSGRRLPFTRAAARNFAKIISNFTFLVGYLIAGFTEKHQALHDLLSGCLVLRRP